jgi:hypothetical protein
MDKDFSKKVIRNTFENKFDKSRFANFIVELLNLDSQVINEAYVSYNTNYIPGIYRPYIDSFEKIAGYEPGGAKLDILVVRLNKERSVERARTMQRNFVSWYLRGGCDGQQRDAALAAFVSPDEYDWRFSLIKMDYSIAEDEKGKVKISEQFSSAKRWSFLVGSNERSHTAQVQLLKIVERDDKNITLEQLEEAFNIEKVTKEFFEKYRELFFKTKEALDKILVRDLKIKTEFELKNIETVDFTKKLLGQIVFLYFLQKKGWFGVSREGEWGTGPKKFLRELFEGKHKKYKNFFNDILEPLFYEALRVDRGGNDDYYNEFNCKIPFLNGGLFDPIGDYDWVKTEINIPNRVFSNPELTKEGDIGTGILDIFDRYNFTVQEDEPLEKEVAVDPEMLGKVFENLLEVKDRKSKGTYYTPREIVHYMCKQSLINYLGTELEGKAKKEDIENLVNIGEKIGDDKESSKSMELDIFKDISGNAVLIDDKLASVKVCDPAVGSGAFLVGMMSEIVRTRNVLSKYIDRPSRNIYELKRESIENSLYGVDIDPGAVEICKLRLWLSLVVDEEDIRQIKPLPNLDYKIVCGNSLLGVEINLFNQQEFDQLEEIKPKYFSETNIRKKQDYKNQIERLIDKITNNHKEFDFEVYFSEIFHKEGFDIVIANPPYGSDLNKNEKDALDLEYADRRSKNKNSAIYFIYLASKILKKNGINSFIVPKSLCYSLGWNQCASFIIPTLIKLIDSGKAFDQVKLEQVIFLSQKDTNLQYYINGRYNGEKIIEFGEIDKNIFSNYKVLLAGQTIEELNLIKKIISQFKNNIGEYIYLKRGLNWQSKVKKNPGRTPIYRGAQIYPYFLDKSTDFINLNNFSKEEYKYLMKPKILNQLAIAHVQNPYPHFYLQANIDLENKLVFETISCTFIKDSGINIKFLLAINNSKLFAWLLYKFIYSNAIRSTRYDDQYVNRIPFFNFKSTDQKPFIDLVNRILDITNTNDYLQNEIKKNKVRKYMKRIDKMVYKLYRLTPEEIEIVEDSVN